MARSLSLSLRPRSFVEMFGQQRITQAIRNQLKHREPNGYLFSGESGSGKTTLARIVGVSFNCRHQKLFGNPCQVCYKNRKKFGIYEVNAAHFSGIDAIKEIAGNSEYAPLPGTRRRVIIMDECQLVSKPAQNVLLKYVEDAPRTTKWIFGTTDPEAMIPALRGRCTQYPMLPLVDKEAEKFVHWAAAKAKIDRSLDEFIEQVHRHSLTSPRNILQALEKYAAGMDPDIAIVNGDSNVNTKRLCRSLALGEWKPVRAELEKATPNDARLIRGSILGYFRAILVNPKPTAKLRLVAWAIQLVNTGGWGDDHAMLAKLSADCYEIASKFPG